MTREDTIRIQISEDRMRAEICVSPDAALTEEELLQAIKAEGICHGLKTETILQALQNRGATVVIAEGTRPVSGKDDQIKWHVEEHLLYDEIQKSIRDDLRQKIDIPAVEPGQPLAEKIPGHKGTPGMDVCGKAAAPPAVTEIELRAMKGTQLSADGLSVSAAANGRPRLEQKGRMYRFQVLPVYIHRGDVTVATGHLSFQGDVAISGNMTEGTSVTASGSVDVLGNVIGAAIISGQNIRVRGNVIQSRLLSGSDRKFAADMLPLLDKIIESLHELAVVLDHLDSRGQLEQLPFAQIASRVVSLRFTEYTETLNMLAGMLQEAAKTTPTPAGVVEAAEAFGHFGPDSWQTRSDSTDAAVRANRLQFAFRSLMEADAHIELGYALNAEIQAAGRITVKGQGSLHSTLTAGDEVRILGKLRSGTVTAKHYLFAKEVGSDAGAVTTLCVDNRGKIEFDRAYENTILKVGRSVSKVTETTGSSRTFLDKEGRVQLMARH
ncbi:MAG: FapA family protein [Bacillota bacterium]|nr:FapA family protein [Bacillota bacterium]MDW7682989.1 FapA family protein [Bacillota bacterium]